MNRVARSLIGLVVLGIAGAALAWVVLGKGSEIAATAVPDPAGFAEDQVNPGAELVALGDCVVCHTAPQGKAFAGGLSLETPFGTVYSTNITPDPATGIGTWSEAAFIRSMREGMDRQGNHLFPVFPIDPYAKVTISDLQAIYAFLMTQEPVVAPAHDNELRFPFGLRPLLAGWKILYLRQGQFEPDPGQSAEANRGAYLVAGWPRVGRCRRSGRHRIPWRRGRPKPMRSLTPHWPAPTPPSPPAAPARYCQRRKTSAALHAQIRPDQRRQKARKR